MTKRDAAKRSAQVKAALHSLAKEGGKGAFEELLETPVDGIRFSRIISGHFKIILRVVEDVVHVSDIFDPRRDPGKMSG